MKCITQHFTRIIVLIVVCTLHISHPRNTGSVYLHQLRHTMSASTVSPFRTWTPLGRSTNFPPIQSPKPYFFNTILLMPSSGPFPSRSPSTILYGSITYTHTCYICSPCHPSLVKPIFGDDRGQLYGDKANWLDNRRGQGSVSGGFECYLLLRDTL
jgi:hypothetical protein